MFNSIHHYTGVTEMFGKMIRAILPLLLIISIGCRQQTESISIVSGENLLQNPSFEENGNSSGDYWRIHNYPGLQFAKDAPPNGGTWSLSLTGDWRPASAYVSQTLVTPAGVRDFRLTFWTKNEWGGNQVLVRGIYADTTQTVASLTAQASSDWRQFSLTFQLPTPAPDSLRVELWAPPTQLARIITLYDLVSLEAIQ